MLTTRAGKLTMPLASLLPTLVERYRASDDEIVLLGGFTRRLARPPRADYSAILLDFLRATRLYNSDRYLTGASVAGWDAPFIAVLAARQSTGRDREERASRKDARALR